MSFRNKKFSNTIYSALKESKSVSLRMLIEAEEDSDDAAEESASDDPFAMDDTDSSDAESNEESSDDPFGGESDNEDDTSDLSLIHI